MVIPVRSFEEIVGHLTSIQTDSMPTFLADTQFHIKLTDVLEHCLEYVNDPEYRQYVQEQLTDEEFIVYDFEKIRGAVREKIKYTFDYLTEDEA
ncbi:hypothetical protein P4K23_28095 [Bacillus cereus]|uniref:hypothetical protein n=1 Tax=Bacillus toyonensis TaxID=155322 RepID=UPI000BFDBFEC|nr:hypothetical protein [Bacillus toyonensis]MEB9857259.1 hypothetical protein [Bacillus cereus]MEB9891866.1 hypothetical protein [Bacillus cereus]PHA86244.1 hypothetical protein COE77_17935 [Bacillus toyonensis]